MSANSDTGHAKNAFNYEMFTTRITDFGSKYDPSRAQLKLDALLLLLTSIIDVMELFNTALGLFKDATNDREAAFNPLRKLCTRIVRHLESCEILPQKLDDARYFQMKMQGGRAKPLEDDAPSEESNAKPGEENIPEEGAENKGGKSRSVSQLSFVYQISHFDSLLKLLQNEPLYAPNEEDLKISSLVALLADLRDKNTAANKAEGAVKNARIARNKVLYANKTGMYDITLAVKKYVSGAVSENGFSKSELKQLTTIKFINYKTDDN